MFKTFSAVAVTLVAATAAAPAAQAWSPPTTLSGADEANPLAQAAFDGSVLSGWLEPQATLSKGLGPLRPLTAADPYETVWASGLDSAGDAAVLTLRKHKPVQRVRATLVAADGTRGRTYTISDNTHSAAQPHLAVAPDGTAVAAWQWHDRAGWRVQAAIRRPGASRFGKPQNISPPAAARLRPSITVAAGEGGRAALSWQVQTGQDAPLHVVSATAATFGADQVLADGGRWADVSMAVAPDGAVTVAYLGIASGSVGLRVASGAAGAPLGDPVLLSQGGKGTSSGPQSAIAISADGTTTVAWAKPGDRYEEGGTLEVFTRTPGAPAFGAPQTLAEAASGIVAAGGPGSSAAVAWMTGADRAGRLHWRVNAALRTGSAFDAPQQLSDDTRNALWPTIAMTPSGKTIAAWVTNTSGGGSGQPTVSENPAG